MFIYFQVCALLSSAERYIHFKCTKSLVQKVLEFVDEHGRLWFEYGIFIFDLISSAAIKNISCADALLNIWK